MQIHSPNIITPQNKSASFRGTFVVNDQRLLKNSDNYKRYLAEKFDKVVGTYDKQVQEDEIVLKSLSENDTLVFLQLKQLGIDFMAKINKPNNKSY